MGANRALLGTARPDAVCLCHLRLGCGSWWCRWRLCSCWVCRGSGPGAAVSPSRSGDVPVLRRWELWRQEQALVPWVCSNLCLRRDLHGLGHVWGELGVPRAPTRWGQRGDTH